MTTVDLDDAVRRFRQLVERAGAGEEVVILEKGRAVARLVAPEPSAAGRHPGTARGEVHIHADFDDPLPAAFRSAFEP